MLDQRRTTNILLLVIVIPLVFYLLKTLSFIFVPLVSSMFIALLFLPIMRWFNKRKVPKALSIIMIILVIIGGLKIGGELIKLSSKQILATDDAFFNKAEEKLTILVISIEEFFGVKYDKSSFELSQFIKKDNI